MRNHKILLALAVLVGLILPLMQVSAADASGPVHITKIHYAQTGTNMNTEYIVFKNGGSKAVTITGWKIISSPSTDNQAYKFPTTTIPAGAVLTLYSGKGTNSAGRRYWGSAVPIWNNDGDKAVLKNAGGSTVDTCQYAGGGTTAYC